MKANKQRGANMLVRCSTLCVAGALYLDWKSMPDEWLPFVVGGATILTIIDIIMEKVFK